MTPVLTKAQLSTVADTQINGSITNTSDKSISSLSLSSAPLHAGEGEAGIQPNAPIDLAPGEMHSFQITVSPWKLATLPPALSLLAKFTVAGDGTPRMAFATVELLPPAALEPEKLATVEAKASLTTLKSGQSEPIYLLVHNKSLQPLMVKRVEANGPPFIEFKNGPSNRKVAAGRTAVFRLEAKAADRVRPGEQQLVFRLPVSVGGTDFDLVTTQTAKVGVAGESEVLTALGIPSLLLLPGFLVLATASIFWRLRFLRDESDDGSFPFPLKEPESWVLTVVGSALILFVAWLFGTNLLDQYSLYELVVLWLISMVIGFAVYVAAQLISNGRRRSRVPSSSDDPIVVLEKLAKQGLDLERPRFSYDTGSGTVELFLLQPPNDKRLATWSAPKIVYKWETLDAKLNERIQEQLDRSHDATALAATLREGVDGKLLTVCYSSEAGNVHSALAIPKEKIGSVGGPAVVVVEG